jgi:uncharacterized membrane protein YeiB
LQQQLEVARAEVIRKELVVQAALAGVVVGEVVLVALRHQVREMLGAMDQAQVEKAAEAAAPVALVRLLRHLMDQPQTEAPALIGNRLEPFMLAVAAMCRGLAVLAVAAMVAALAAEMVLQAPQTLVAVAVALIRLELEVLVVPVS